MVQVSEPETLVFSCVLNTHVMEVVVFILGLVLQGTRVRSLCLVSPEEASVLGIRVRPLSSGSPNEASLSGVLDVDDLDHFPCTMREYGEENLQPDIEKTKVMIEGAS